MKYYLRPKLPTIQHYQMLPVLIRLVSRYVPLATLPVAAVVGIIGYNIESLLSDKYTPFQKNSIQEKRLERLSEDVNLTLNNSLKDHKFVPQSVFEKNLSPSLK